MSTIDAVRERGRPFEIRLSPICTGHLWTCRERPIFRVGAYGCASYVDFDVEEGDETLLACAGGLLEQ